MNGRSAAICWRCEDTLTGPSAAALFAEPGPESESEDHPGMAPEMAPLSDDPHPAPVDDPLGSRPARFTTAPVPLGPQPTFAAQHFPVLTAEVPFGHPAVLPTAPPGHVRGSRLGTLVTGIVLLALGGYWLFAPATPTPPAVAPSASPSVRADPGPTAPAEAPPPEAGPAIDPAQALALPPGTRTTAGGTLGAAVAEPVAPAAARKRVATHAPSAAARPARAPPAACTPTIAALGLCTARSSTTKE